MVGMSSLTFAVLVGIIIFMLLIARIFAGMALRSRNIFQATIDFNYEFIEQYLQNGGDINAVSKYDMTPLMIACDKGYTEGGLKYANKNDGDYESTMNLIRYLIDNGADVNKRDSEGETALKYAKISRDRVELLANAGANLDNINNSGETIIIRSARHGYLRTVTYFLELGADPRIKDRDGKDAIDHAIENDHKEVADFIWKYMENEENQCPQPMNL